MDHTTARATPPLTLRTLLSLLLCVAGVALLLVHVPSVSLTWDTASEVETAGFNVYRRPEWDSSVDWVQVNAEVIPAAGDELVGASYTLDDDDLRPGRQYRYRIEEVEWDGGITQYPEEVVVRAGLPSRLTKVEGAVLLLVGMGSLWLRRRAQPAA